MPFRRFRSAPAVLTLLLALALAAPAAAQTSPSEDRQAAEEALADAQRLAGGRGIRTGRELTTALLEVAQRRGALSRTDRTEADSLLGRPTDSNDTQQPGGPYTVPEQPPACSDHFCVHWVRDAPTGDQPSNVDTDTDGDTIPDYVEKVIDAADQSYAVEITEITGLGWQPPKSDGSLGGDDAKTDIYIKDLNPGTAKGLYGYANTDSPQSGRSRYGFVVVDNDYNAFEFPKYGGDPDDPIDVTVAHEFNHVLQFTYDMAQDDWMYEATATWVEDKVFPAIDDYLIYLPQWDDRPEQPLTTPGNNKEYGSAVFNHWLDRKYGEDTIRDAWAGSALPANTVQGGGFAPQAYGAAIVARGGAGFGRAFGEFATAAATWDVPDPDFHEGNLYGDVDRSTLQPDGTLHSTVIDHTAFAVYDIPVPTADRLDLAAALPSGTSGYVALVGDDGAEVTRAVQPLPNGGGTTVSLADPGSFSRITAVLANADVQHDGYEPSCFDWNWTRDDQTASFRLSEHAAGDPISSPLATPAAHISDCTPTVTTPTPTSGPSATATPSPTPTPTVTPPPPSPATSVQLSRSTTRISSVLRKGVLAVFARTNKAGGLSARATVDSATAKRLKVGRRTTTAGTGRRTATAPARLKVNIKLTRKLRSALKRNRKRALRVKVLVRLTPVDGTAADTDTITIKLRP